MAGAGFGGQKKKEEEIRSSASLIVMVVVVIDVVIVGSFLVGGWVRESRFHHRVIFVSVE